MAKKHTYVHVDHHGQELQNFSLEKLSAHPTGVDLYEGRKWILTTDNREYVYLNGAIRRIVISEDLNTFGKAMGGFDASAGYPITGSGVDPQGNADNTIEAGDWWYATVPGTLAGTLAAGSSDMEVGDKLIALVDDASNAADFMSIQSNINVSTLGDVRTATLANQQLLANTPLSFSSAMSSLTPPMTTAKAVTVIDDSTGEEIDLRKDLVAKEVESNVNITSVTIYIIG